jgi:predicted DNA-binding antitoxin AbrB/MazE fold protein
LVIDERSTRKDSEQDRQTVYAIYEDGVFRLIEPLSIALPEKQLVRVTIETASSLDLMMNLYEGLPKEEVDEIEKIMLDRSNFFPERDWSWLDDDEDIDTTSQSLLDT